MEKVQRTLSEEFMTRSPNTQVYIKSMVMTIPTSKANTEEHSNIEAYYRASPNTRTNMETYGLIPPNIRLIKK